MHPRALILATVLGTVLQLAMVLIGHTNPAVARLFAIAGVTISLFAGLLYGVFAHGGSLASLVLGGLVAGGACAFLGILVSFALRDVPAVVLLGGTLGSAAGGALGGALARVFTRA